ncbi:glycosyltransferase family 2 protein [Pantoea sp. Taur]|uniref:glycosyltransferase family 2 protein n=1 Tax=Pantoea sp. Taur TaxID=2576757 RepID=UPI0013526393|nr:glycosyltransferase family 2 protein [Pantoea sp. Taur]MXP58575.1 glycosyltransferase family 2 protein [Pantoea sp. Taur]
MQSYILNMNNENKLAIMLCTYNGDEYLREQIDSIISQEYDDWFLFVSDDGSNDTTLEILNEYQRALGQEKLIIVQGPKKGFAANFMNVMKNIPGDFGYYAFCDQDDIWLKDKLSTAVKVLKRDGASTKPQVYCSRTTLVDENNNIIGESPLFCKKPNLRNALVQSIAGGNTMVLNRQAFNIVKCTPEECDIVSHDWWVYILICAANGVVIYDPESKIRYRQHTKNLVGSNTGWMARCLRLKGLLKGKLKGWNQKNINALSHMDKFISGDNKDILNRFIVGRDSGFFKRSYILLKLRLYRQTLVGSIALILAILLNKI